VLLILSYVSKRGPTGCPQDGTAKESCSLSGQSKPAIQPKATELVYKWVVPLLANARDILRANLEQIRDGQKPRLVVIGTITANQLTEINANRHAQELPPITGEVVFVGKHVYKSRIAEDGYTIEDVLDQITSAMECTAVVIKSLKMTGMENPTPRADRYGNNVRDRAVFECSARHPRPELLSVMPKGDNTKPGALVQTDVRNEKGHPM
jgi:hypothetical protein